MEPHTVESFPALPEPQAEKPQAGTASADLEADPGPKDLSAKPGLEWWQAMFSLVLVVIGAGVMALPNLPRKGGLWLSIILMVLCGCTITESGIAMWKGIMAANQKSSGEKGLLVQSYEDFGRAAFGTAGEGIVVVILALYFTGICASFATLIADSCAHLDVIFHGSSAPWLSSQGWLVAMFPLFAGMALLPNVTAVAKMVPLAIVSILGLCAIIVVKSAMDSQQWQQWPDLVPGSLHRAWPESASGVGIVVASLFGAFGVNGNVPSVLCEMKDPMQFPLAFKSAMGIIGVIYMCVMLTGYYGYGEFLQGDLIASLTSFPGSAHEALHVPYTEWTGPKAPVLDAVMSSLLFVKLVIGFPLNMMVIFYSFQTFHGTRDKVPPGSMANKAMRLATVFLSILLAQMIPNFGQLFALVCAVFGPLLQCIMPLLFGYQIRMTTGSGVSSWRRRVFHAGMVGIALYTLTIGTGSSVQDILGN